MDVDTNDTTAQRAWVESLLTAHGRHLLGYATRFLGAAQGEEVVQEAFFRLWQIPAAERPEHPAAWLFTVCRRLCIDRGRKDSRMHLVDPHEFSGHADPQAAEADTSEEGDRKSAVDTLLKQMTPQQQEAVRLKFMHDRSYKEISLIMGISVSHVGVLLHNALKRVRDVKANFAFAGGVS